MKNTVKLTQSQFRSLIQESVKRIINELDSRTYMSAYQKSDELAQNDRSKEFLNAGRESFMKETGNKRITITPNGFSMWPEGLGGKLSYDKTNDIMFYIAPDNSKTRITRNYGLKNRNDIYTIIKYLEKYRPDSKYNDKNLWIA